MKTKTGCKLKFSGSRRATRGSSLYGLENCLEPVLVVVNSWISS
ncbi:hypothetical protein [Flavobacterium sp. LS1P3]